MSTGNNSHVGMRSQRRQGLLRLRIYLFYFSAAAVSLIASIFISPIYVIGTTSDPHRTIWARLSDSPLDITEQFTVGQGGELHPQYLPRLTTNQGVLIADDENSLKANERGPTLLEDFILREKITHFDHERIPERVVHARGSGAHGYFECTESLSSVTSADFLQRRGERTPVFVRFSTVAGGAGSVDLPRDVRGFATRFYTKEGNFDLVGNNIPVFFIQDAMKFPDLVHSVKMEPDRGFPQSASAHHNFWDFISLMPESMHMIMWVMSDRAIPRSLRTMQGFGVNTFRFVNSAGNSSFVKFHWRPKAGTQSVVWDEAVKISGADPDFHRRDLWEAIDSGNYPEWEFGVQVLTEADAQTLDFDVLDATKLIPEEQFPLRIIGKLVLDRNPDNFFAETEQVAFHPGSVVPGIDFSNDPLLQGRLFSYIDTQLLRLGGPNFHELPINRPKCPYGFHNMQRDGPKRHTINTGRINYSPNSAEASNQGQPANNQGQPANPENETTPTPTPPTADSGDQSFAGLSRPENGYAVRQRSASFADHYSQPRMFYLSQSTVEQNHIVMALIVELAKVDDAAIRRRIIGHLRHIDLSMATRVADNLGFDITSISNATTQTLPKDLPESPATSILRSSTNDTINGRVVGFLMSEGADSTIFNSLKESIEGEGAKIKIIAPKHGSISLSNGDSVMIMDTLSGSPSVLFDAIVVLPSNRTTESLLRESFAVNWVADAFNHLKVIGYSQYARPLLEKAHVEFEADNGVILLTGSSSTRQFISQFKLLRVWDREERVHNIP